MVLGGKSNYYLPCSQLNFKEKLILNAPNDMLGTLDKNDQKIYVVPRKKLAIIRLGNSAENINFTLSDFDNDL